MLYRTSCARFDGRPDNPGRRRPRVLLAREPEDSRLGGDALYSRNVGRVPRGSPGRDLGGSGALRADPQPEAANRIGGPVSRLAIKVGVTRREQYDDANRDPDGHEDQ
jgi:hypothetical protein